MILHKEVEQLGNDGGYRVADLAETFDIHVMNLRPMRDVQPGHHHRNTRLEDDLRRFRVDVDIKLGGGLPVAEHHCAAHHHDARDLVVQFRVAIQQQGDVGLRACGDNRHRLRAFAQRFGHQLYGGTVLRGKIRLRQRRAVEPAFAVNVVGDDKLPHQRLTGAAGHRNILALQQRQHAQHVAQGFLRRLVAGGGGDGFDVQFG